jgi:cytochrome c peroxidase
MRGRIGPGSNLGGAVMALAVAAVLSGCGGGGAPVDERLETAAKPPPPRAAVEPLQLVTPPDVNRLGLLDGSGTNAGQWTQITKPGQQIALQRLGKALFWDMQVGGDGIQSCASCHYNAGADNRVVHQLSPGLKGGDTTADLPGGLNKRLAVSDFAPTGAPNRGLPVSEAALLAGGATADLADGTPGLRGPNKPSPTLDVNDVISSQGIRGGIHQGVTNARVDTATLLSSDPGFDLTFNAPAPGQPNTVRRVEPRNSPSTINAVFNLRNFWDGRADMFFNGVNPLGMRDPAARVKVAATGGALSDLRLDIPFSSLASQAVGPIESHFEMVFGDPANGRMPRSFRELGKKLTLPGAVPLRGQFIATDDSLLSTLRNGGSGRGLNTSYVAEISAIFQERFWNSSVCLAPDGTSVTDPTPGDGVCPDGSYTLMQYNFPLFFGLAVQAYEATLVSGQTIVDLIAGGIATGTVVNGRNTVNVAGLSLDGCIALAAQGTSAAQQAAATNACTAHYARFIHPLAVSGAESASAPNPVPAGTPIGGCATPPNCAQPIPAARLAAAQATLLNVNRGLDRFFSGATACSVCHFNPEFTGATVSTVTGFGMAPELLNQGQARRAEIRAVMERMNTFNGSTAVYDTGFYNIGARPTFEDLSLGDSINGVPIALNKLFDVMGGGNAAGLNAATIGTLASPQPGTIAAKVAGGELRIPFSTTDLRPVPFPFNVGCGAGLVGGGNANNNPNVNCTANVVPGERLLRNGAFKAPGLRNVKFTGPYLHNGSKMNLRQVLEFYKTAGHFTALNLNNLDAGMRTFSLGAAEESALIEMMETGLTDWRVAHQADGFDHPEICISHGHDPQTGASRLVSIPAVGRQGGDRIATFEEVLRGQTANRANNLLAACNVQGIGPSGDISPITALDGLSLIDLPTSLGAAP